MYETQFNQYHGWYTRQASLRAGFWNLYFTSENTSNVDPHLLDLRARAAAGEREAVTRWRRVFQDEARTEFGYRKVGQGFVSETQLAMIIGSLLPEEVIVRHHRPDWLDGLELDIWIPGLKLGVEYQGQQHYKAIKAWGGERALLALQQRDARKARMCCELGVSLVEVRYTEPLTLEHIRSRLEPFVAPPQP
jgi:hypothetical protein